MAEPPARLQAMPAWMTLVTRQFLYAGIVHIAGNMLHLWIFGRGVEAALGTKQRPFVFHPLPA